jgi:maltose alpha-D-glucosyltransferase/alpha-amylase
VLVGALHALARIDRPVLRTRIHGDYHLGQVLRTREDFVIVDFEGEPARSLAERRARQSPVKDVAGMLRSLCYAAASARMTLDPAGEDARRATAARTWEAATGAQFLRAYRETAGDAGFVPSDTATFVALLEAYLLEKAFYELRYELDNRPSWIGIPLAGIRSLRSTPGTGA